MENTIYRSIEQKHVDFSKMDATEQKERDLRLWDDVTETEKMDMIYKSVRSCRDTMLQTYSNVPMIDKLLIEEFNDLVSQAWIYAAKKAEKYSDFKPCFAMIYSASLYAFHKVLDERLGKRIQKRPNGKNGKAVTVGRHTEEATEDIMTMKTKTERVFKTNDFTEIKIDLELTLSEDELKTVRARLAGYTMQEIADHDGTNKMTVSRTCKKIREKMEKAWRE